MVPNQTAVIRISSRRKGPRANLNNASSRKRTESNFLRSFEPVVFCSCQCRGSGNRRVLARRFRHCRSRCISWTRKSQSGEFTALSLEKQLSRRQMFAFEGKIKDWRRALQQAFRYRYFADKAIVVMPQTCSAAALNNLDTFRQAFVGFWTFDTAFSVVREHYTPVRTRAFSAEARLKAIRMLSSKVKFQPILQIAADWSELIQDDRRWIGPSTAYQDLD